MMTMIHKLFIMPCAVAVLLLCSSCVKETISDTSSTNANVTFDFDWSNLQHSEPQPSAMHIAANRIIYHSMTTSDGGTKDYMTQMSYATDSKTGYFLNNVPNTITSEGNKNLTVFPLKAGEYKFLTLNNSLGAYDFSEVTSYINSGKTANIGGHRIISKTHKASSDTIVKMLGDKWSDYNVYNHPDGSEAEFIYLEDEPLVIDSTDITTLEKDEQKTITLTPKILTQNIDIYFDIQKKVNEIQFAIDSVYCVFSGIPSSVDVGTRALDCDETNKLVTKMRCVSAGTVPGKNSASVNDNRTNSVVRYYQSLNILGITENITMEDNKYVGPGIMQLIMFVSLYENSDTVTSTKVINGIVNMHNAIKRVQLQQYDALRDITTKTNDYTLMPLNASIEIGKKLLVGDDAGDSGLPQWTDKDIEGDDDHDIY